ncbi:Di-copper centre-containing protein [Cryphonectria parasitica EP155]|uniref:Di-copper centre-containing protein n=1 Tax=Cryphonectria parasitica (strain ATCC 38755 / EP155) TaxID=660469 RepID=A0A9P4XU17_CRYP1|nr:Di-copper centre-containing protein [Cryphonectria parasitica EP155]KAF3760963.1 Di-copper centre-containing protein [Cryphonectria parasitica EP155]
MIIRSVDVSDIPLDDFGAFNTLTLQQVVDDPTLLDTASTINGTSSNDLGNIKTASLAVEESPQASSCTSPQTRIEWRDYSSSDRQAFVDGISCLTQLPSAGSAYAPSTSRYEDLVRTHQKLTTQVHGNGIFLLWHRYFVHLFEQALRSECGFDRAMPWWDETLDSGAFHLSTLFTSQYFGNLSGPTNGAGTCVTDGVFAHLTCHIGPGTNNVQHCLSRALNETDTAQSSTAYVDYCAGFDYFGTFSSCAEMGPHAWTHNGIGSVMSDVYSSPSDPIFFMHHLFVDHELAAWQEADSSRKSTVADACTQGYAPCQTAVTLDTVLNMNGLGANVTVGNVLDTQGGPLCYTYDYY